MYPCVCICDCLLVFAVTRAGACSVAIVRNRRGLRGSPEGSAAGCVLPAGVRPVRAHAAGARDAQLRSALRASCLPRLFVQAEVDARAGGAAADRFAADALLGRERRSQRRGRESTSRIVKKCCFVIRFTSLRFLVQCFQRVFDAWSQSQAAPPAPATDAMEISEAASGLGGAEKVLGDAVAPTGSEAGTLIASACYLLECLYCVRPPPIYIYLHLLSFFLVVRAPISLLFNQALLLLLPAL